MPCICYLFEGSCFTRFKGLIIVIQVVVVRYGVDLLIYYAISFFKRSDKQLRRGARFIFATPRAVTPCFILFYILSSLSVDF